MNEWIKKLMMGTSKKSKSKGSMSAWGNHVQRQQNLKKIAKANEGRKNHVSESDLSPGGFPFHFSGYKKTVKP